MKKNLIGICYSFDAMTRNALGGPYYGRLPYFPTFTKVTKLHTFCLQQYDHGLIFFKKMCKFSCTAFLILKMHTLLKIQHKVTTVLIAKVNVLL